MIIFDLDGTLALDHHRSHFLKGDVKHWDEYFNACVHDEPNTPIINVMIALWSAGHKVGICSGRSEKVRQHTINWLVDQGIWEILSCFCLRPEHDRTQDDVLKLSWVKRLEEDIEPVDLIFEDRQRVVDMWRANGYTCCQVAPGAF